VDNIIEFLLDIVVENSDNYKKGFGRKIQLNAFNLGQMI